MIVIIDYGMGNVGSIKNMINHIGFECQISNNPQIIKDADKLILPGVGHFASAMKNLNDLGIIELLNEKVMIKKTPLLGICLGMQLLTEYSEEGNVKGLGWIKAKTIKFDFASNEALKVPHMGWDFIKPQCEATILTGISNRDRYYFVHSYYVKCTNKVNSIATTDYGLEFDSIIQEDNIVGMQFHPEKSHKYGMNLLINYLEIF